MLFDTDILIWCLRGNPRAARVVDSDSMRATSVVNVMELLQGSRDRKEVGLIRSFLKDLGFEVIPLTENIGHRALVYVEEYALKSGLHVADALVAATAVERQAILCSGNLRHYRAISELEVKGFRAE
ncbi:MAG: type II toxin-antitoxin system VapC family toxin [Candidatus Omnitrophica bacterium]|nr:hypothetical protein [bacterium]NUN95390.1 type II toxin-antitoxin system VapC family toxin [Candidatus Omnitrophota bacterium]